MVVEHKGYAVARPEVGEREDGLVPSARAAMEHYYSRRAIVKVTEDFVVDEALPIQSRYLEWDAAFLRERMVCFTSQLDTLYNMKQTFPGCST